MPRSTGLFSGSLLSSRYSITRPTCACQTRQRQPPRQRTSTRTQAPESPARENGQGRGVVIGIGLLLPAGRIEYLAEVASLVQQAHAGDRHAEIAGRLEIVTGQHPQAAG